MKKLFSLLFLATLFLPVQADNIVVNNTTRNYIVYAPKDLGENRPLLISCHGMNQDANYQRSMLQIESVADTAKFVTVFPNGIDKGWDIGGDRDINFVLALIDKMVEQYKIDRNRVYLSGFSMGGMFTYHAMNRIADKIAAFAPISGYPMGGTTANANVRPIPIIHTHGTSDDVVNFGGVQGALNAWISHNGCPKTAEVVKSYRGASTITRHTWGPGNNNVEVVLMEMGGKGHWISNDYGVLTGDEIWKFCKRYSLQMTDPSVRITTPDDGLTYVTFGGTSEIPDITIKATANDPDGEVVKVTFYDGDELLEECTAAPYTCVLKDLKKGDHSIRAVATDNEGHTGSSKIVISVVEPTGNYIISKVFNAEGSVPEGWTTYDGQEKRTGFASGFASGSRVFHFTGEQHDIEWGLYTRNVTGGKRAGYARFGEKTTKTTMTCYPGNYQLYTKMINWNQPDFSPITIAVETIDGQEIYAYTFTPTVNAGNAASNSFSGTATQSFAFDIMEKGRYVISFYTADAPWADLVVGQTAFRRNGAISGISSPASLFVPETYYNLSGQRVQPTTPGLYIRQGKKVVVGK